MRLFIAIDLPRSFKAEVTRIQKELKQLSCGGRFVPANNFHITLHFIGETPRIFRARLPPCTRPGAAYGRLRCILANTIALTRAGRKPLSWR